MEHNGYRSYITDLHLNLHADQIDELPRWFAHCERVCDFFTLAYYPYHVVKVSDTFSTEAEIDPELMRAQWAHILDFLRERERADGFVCLPGFEWQGAGDDGDHNVYFKTEGPIALPSSYRELVETYRGQDAIGIPHHLAYSVGNRGKRWDTHDEGFSPVAEVFSHHGSSERDATCLPMKRHVHMGPRVDESSVAAGLRRGYHFGLIASGDNHEIPAMVEYGRAGVWAKEYSKDGIWDALVSRRTFGFTGPRIDVWAEAEGHPLGSVFSTESEEAELLVRARAASKVERVELYRDGDLFDVRVVRWRDGAAELASDVPARLKFRVEFGWGPDTKYFPEAVERRWEGELVTTGEVVDVEPVYSSFENRHEVVDAHTVTFVAKSSNAGGTHWVRDGGMRTEGFIFELLAAAGDTVTLSCGGRTFMWPVEKILAGSFLEVFEDEAKALVEAAGHPSDFYRSDAWYHNAYKVKVYQGFTSDAYEVKERFSLPVEAAEHGWFAKVVQADGQTAWASPIWVRRA